jgi:hypothetical protein
MSHLRTMFVLAGLACLLTPAMTLAESPVAALSEPNTGSASAELASPPSRRTFTRADMDTLLADPAIRAHAGMAENAYDFTDPNGVPGFGPIESIGR